MSGQDPLEVARQAEKDLNSYEAKTGAGRKDDSALDSGVDTSVTSKFPGSTVTVGSAASGAGDNREIPDEEGGDRNTKTGQQTKASDFEGVGGPQDKEAADQVARGGDDDVGGNVTVGGGGPSRG